MKSLKRISKGITQIILFGLLAGGLLALVWFIVESRPKAPGPQSQDAYPQTPDAADPQAYPPPLETPATKWTATPVEPIPIDTPIVRLDVAPTLTPWPTFTPFPSPTLRPGPTNTPVPLNEPAKDATGSLFYLSGAEQNKASLFALSLDSLGMAEKGSVKNSDEMNLTGLIAYPSPDGSRIAFFGEWCTSSLLNVASGKLGPMFPDSLSPCAVIIGWHPDNRHILILAQERIPGLWLVDTDTWEYTTLAIPGIGTILNGAVSPNGQSVIYSWQRDTFSPSEVWMVNTDGRDARLVSTVNETINYFTWSPDGSQVLMNGGGDRPVVMDSEGKNLQTLDLHTETPCIPGHYAPIWSPDGRFLAIQTDTSDLPYTDPWNPEAFKFTDICLIDLKTKEAHSLISGDNSGSMHPTWSPDGNQVAFVTDRNGFSEIWIVNTDGSNLRQLTFGSQLIRFPHWVKP